LDNEMHYFLNITSSYETKKIVASEQSKITQVVIVHPEIIRRGKWDFNKD